MKQLWRICRRKRKVHKMSYVVIFIGLFLTFPGISFLLFKPSTVHVKMTSNRLTHRSRPEQCFNTLHPNATRENLVNKLIEPVSEYREPIYKEPVDLVYLWVNGSDKKFAIDMKRQKALEDVKLYNSPVVCSKTYGAHVNIPVIVVYPVILQPSRIPRNEEIKLIFSVTDGNLNNTVIIPKQGRKASAILNTLTKIGGQTHICTCGYITNEVNNRAKKILKNMYLIQTEKHKFFLNFSVDVFLHTEVNNGMYTYALVSDNSSYFTENQAKKTQDGFKTESAILVWDPHSISVAGVPNSNRFEDNNQLLYSLRSVEKYASWIRNIYIITNQQVPSWLNISNQRISVISSQEIFPNKDDLPSFSSPAIESHMHRIPELSETFLFMCDDFFFGKQVQLSDFYTVQEGLKIFWNGRIGDCMPGCTHKDLGNGKCDISCNNLKCGWDHGECRPIQHEQIKLGHPVGLHYGSYFHTMAMFNRKSYNSKTYNMPPHVPLLVNRKVAVDLENSFHGEFKKSSAMHFRSQFNIQYTMAYYEFVSSTRVVLTTEEIFDKLDEDNSGTLSFQEFQKLRTLTYKDVKKLRGMSGAGELLCDAHLRVSKSEFIYCKCIVDTLKRAKITQPKYKHTLKSKKDGHFIMITSNLTLVQMSLSSILLQPRKFNALNDDMDHNKKETVFVKNELKRFYESLFPKPSQFELERL